MLFLWISIPFVCKGSGTCGIEVMQNVFWCVYYIATKHIKYISYVQKKTEMSYKITIAYSIL